MRIFVVGNQDPYLICQSLYTLDEGEEIEELIGSADSLCMDMIVPWAERNEIPITVVLPDSKKSTLQNYINIIKTEKPDSLLMYDLDMDIFQGLLLEAQNPLSSIINVIAKN